MHSVTAATAKAYEGHWIKWCRFVNEDLDSEDPLLGEWLEEDKPAIVCLFLQLRYDEGMRGKQASSVTAGIRLKFAAALRSTAFLDLAIVTAARTACRMTTKELRAKKDEVPNGSVKLPLCESLLKDLRAKLRAGRGWERKDIDCRMTYIGCMWGYDMDARIFEYTAHEVGNEDRCVRCSDLVFGIRGAMDSYQVGGGSSFFRDLREGRASASHVLGFRVLTASQKTSAPVKAKTVGRRSPEESQFLEDLVTFIAFSKVLPSDELFCRYLERRSGKVDRKRLQGRMVREVVKGVCRDAGLPAEYFSSHSLRKVATTQMRAMGVSQLDMIDRGNYVEGSKIMTAVYDYSAGGHGPLSSNSLVGGTQPSKDDVRSWLPFGVV